MKKTILFLMMMALVSATVSINYVETPTLVKAGESFTVNISYDAAGDSNTTFYWDYSSPETIQCSSTTCLVSFTRTAPNVFGENITIKLVVNDSNSSITETRNITTQRIILTVNADDANATQTLTASGKVTWEDNTSINTSVSVNFGNSYQVLVDAVNGEYSASYVLPEDVKTGEYNITASISNPVILSNLTSVNVKGRTIGNIEITPSYLQVSPDETEANITTLFEYSPNPPNNFTVTLTALGKTYESTELSHTFTILLENATSGDYVIEANAKWVNDDGTEGNAVTTIPLYIQTSTDIAVNYSFNTSRSLEVDSFETLMFNITNKGNVVVKPDYSISGNIPLDWVKITGGEALNPGETEEVVINITIPYSASKGNYDGKVIITSPSTIITIPLDLTITAPSFKFDDLRPEYLIENTPEIEINPIIRNTGSVVAKNITFSIECPKGWICDVNNTISTLIPKDYKKVKAKIVVTNPESVEDKTITIKAVDAAGREATVSTKILIRAESTKIISTPILVYTMESPDFSDGVYYIAHGKELVKLEGFNTTNATARTQRDSTLSTWVVKLGKETQGLGDVCDVSLLVNGNKYDLDESNKEVGQALVGEVGSLVYEIYHFKKLGDCVVHLDYGNGKETITHIVVTGKAPEPSIELTASSIKSLINETIDKSREDERTLIKYIVYVIVIIAGGFLLKVIYKKRNVGFVYNDAPIDKFVGEFNKKIEGGLGNVKKKRGFYDD